MLPVIRHALILMAVLVTALSAPARASSPAVPDPRTGLNWLPLSATAGMSYEQVAPLLSGRGEFAGYTLATADQVATLFTDLFPPADTPAANFARVAWVARRFGFIEHDPTGAGQAVMLGGVIAEPGPAVTLEPLAAGRAPARVPSHAVMALAVARAAPPTPLPRAVLPDSFAAGFDYNPSTEADGTPSYDGFFVHYEYKIAALDGTSASPERTVPPTTSGFFLVQNAVVAGPVHVPEPYAIATVIIGVVGLGMARLVGRLD